MDETNSVEGEVHVEGAMPGDWSRLSVHESRMTNGYSSHSHSEVTLVTVERGGFGEEEKKRGRQVLGAFAWHVPGQN